MPKKEYALEAKGPKRLTLEWSGLWKNMRVQVDGQLLGTIENSAALKAGKEFSIPAGGTLKVQLKQSFANTELQILLNGEPLPGSASDPEQRFATAVNLLMIIGGLNIVAGLVVMLFNVEFLARLGIGLESLIIGVVFLGLGFATKKTRSMVALALGVGLFGLTSVFSIIGAVGATGRPPIGAIVFRVILFMGMAKGFGALKELKAKEAAGGGSTGVGGEARTDSDPFDPPVS